MIAPVPLAPGAYDKALAEALERHEAWAARNGWRPDTGVVFIDAVTISKRSRSAEWCLDKLDEHIKYRRPRPTWQECDDAGCDCLGGATGRQQSVAIPPEYTLD